MTNTFDPSQAAAPAAGPAAFDPMAQAPEEIAIDLSGVSDDFEPLPEGWYLIDIDEIKSRDDQGAVLMSKGESEAGPQPKVIWIFKVAQGECMGRQLFQHTILSGKGAFGLRRILKAFHGDELPKAQMKINLANYRHKKLWVYVKLQKNDSRYNEITQYRPESSPPDVVPGAAPFAPPANIAQRI